MREVRPSKKVLPFSIHTFYIDGLHPLLGSAVSFLPLMCGTIRLAKFNIDQEKGVVKNFTIGIK